jgi:DNA repair protein RadC
VIITSSHEEPVHNHPSGDPKRSRDDIEMTREI